MRGDPTGEGIKLVLKKNRKTKEKFKDLKDLDKQSENR